ncbi:hypothetical protein FSP39_016885 [Pinctada imbricata]|uniref:Uncharacterized protein n=1 Tax=Pinctada imbricata TaxID=66713 RepID=A0AA88YLW8_PINIB|nr:hypothetical protein FSP39_016885 [Pinctada imbricata]
MFTSRCNIDTFVGRYRIKSVAILQLMPRMSTRHLEVDRYNDFVITFNRILKDELKHNRIMTYWKLSGLKHAAVAIYRDGVHLNQDGLIRYYRNIRGAILTLLKSIV